MPRTILEFLGLRTSDHPYESFAEYYRRSLCPFLAYQAEDIHCRKMKKATTEEIAKRGREWATLGSCVVSDLDGSPLVICPHKLEMGDRFVRDMSSYFVGDPTIVREVKLESGRVDWVLIGESPLRGNHTIALEIQALDTTGTGGINDAKRAFKRGGESFTGKSFKYGFNWKMSIKTIMFQILSKFSETQKLDWSYVLVVQDAFLAKMKELYRMQVADVTGTPPREILRLSTESNVIIHAYSVVPGKATHRLANLQKYAVSRERLVEMVSLPTDAEQVRRRLLDAQTRRGRLPLPVGQLREHVERCAIPEKVRDSFLREL